MLLKKPITNLQWLQLYALTFIHIVADMFPGAIAPIIPAVKEHFSLSLAKSLALITVCYISCNLFQVLLGHTRAKKRQPLLLPLGMVAASAICFICFIPIGKFSYHLLITAMIITGSGVAVMHPESLRALHSLKRTSSILGTAIYFNGGHFGFAIGSLMSAATVQYLGLSGLLVLLLPVAFAIALIYILHIRLAVEKPHKPYKTAQETYSFWLLFAMAIPVTISATLLPALLPTALAEMGFKLAYGGLPAAMIGIGIIIGSLFWVMISEKIGQLKTVIIAEILAAPAVIIYLMLIKNHWAVLLLIPTGFCGVAGYTLIVNMARYSRQLVLGRRMGLIVGGSWGIAAAVLILTAPLAEKFTAEVILKTVWLGFITTAIIGLIALYKNKNR